MEDILPWSKEEWSLHIRKRKIEKRSIRHLKKNKVPVWEPLSLTLTTRELKGGLKSVFLCIEKNRDLIKLYEAVGGKLLSPDKERANFKKNTR